MNLTSPIPGNLIPSHLQILWKDLLLIQFKLNSILVLFLTCMVEWIINLKTGRKDFYIKINVFKYICPYKKRRSKMKSF